MHLWHESGAHPPKDLRTNKGAMKEASMSIVRLLVPECVGSSSGEQRLEEKAQPRPPTDGWRYRNIRANSANHREQARHGAQSTREAEEMDAQLALFTQQNLCRHPRHARVDEHA